jgi:pimeloyl-ACP methyl ester carboxylesterase
VVHLNFPGRPYDPAMAVIWLILVFLAVGVLTCAAACVLTAWALVHPPRMTDGKAMWVLRRLSPEDLGMPFQDVEFHIRDERGRPLKIAGWWIPAASDSTRCAVLVHGYADAKVGAIAWAAPWRALGFNLLVVDLRAHGESGGRMCTAGYFERDDLRQVLDELRASRPEEAKEIVLFGVSMGGAVVAAAAEDRDDVAAVVMDSPYADFPAAAAEHITRLGLPGWLAPMAIRLAGWMSGADLTAVDVQSIVARLHCPVLIIESANDSFLPDQGQKLEEAIGRRPPDFGKAEIWSVDGAEHLMALPADPQGYQQRLAQCLDSALPAPGRSGV